MICEYFKVPSYKPANDQGQGLLVVGSSNLSVSAYRLGVEWNLAMNAEASPFTFISYEQDYHAYHQKYPELIRTITEIEESELMLPVKNNEIPPDPSHTDQTSTEKGTSDKIQPRPAQIVAIWVRL